MSTATGAKTVIITGASGNMGAAIVTKFLAEGYRVIGTVTKSGGSKVAASDHFEEVVIDLTNESSTSVFVDNTIKKYGDIDVLVATVGGFAMAGIAGTSLADIKKQYSLNFETAYTIARPVFAHMQQNKTGRIFLIGSKPGLSSLNGKGMIAYGLSKSLLFRLAELMNEEAKGSNVVASVVVPGTIDTPQNRDSMPTADFDAWVKPEAIAEAVYFYCTAAADSIRQPVIKLYNKG